MVARGYGDCIYVEIPANGAVAINDLIYGISWMKAMANEMELKHRTNYMFEVRLTVPGQRMVMKGNWIFSTKADPYSASIIFDARWVLEGYNTIRSITYMTTYTDIGLATIDVEYEPFVYLGPSRFAWGNVVSPY